MQTLRSFVFLFKYILKVILYEFGFKIFLAYGIALFPIVLLCASHFRPDFLLFFGQMATVEMDLKVSYSEFVSLKIQIGRLIFSLQYSQERYMQLGFSFHLLKSMNSISRRLVGPTQTCNLYSCLGQHANVKVLLHKLKSMEQAFELL